MCQQKVTNVELGSVEVVMVVWGLGYGLEKSDEVVMADFAGFEFKVVEDEVRVVKEKLDTSCWLAYIGTCNRIVTQLPVGENEEK